MNVYKRMALGAILFGLIGPVIVAACFATVATIVVTFTGHREWSGVIVGWLSMFALAGFLGYPAGGLPAAVVSAFVGTIATRNRRRNFYVDAIVVAVVVSLLFLAVIGDYGDRPILFGTLFSIPVTVVLSKFLLAIICRSQASNTQSADHTPGSMHE